MANNIQDFITNQSDLKIEIEGLQEQIQNEEINSIDASERITETLKENLRTTMIKWYAFSTDSLRSQSQLC